MPITSASLRNVKFFTNRRRIHWIIDGNIDTVINHHLAIFDKRRLGLDMISDRLGHRHNLVLSSHEHIDKVRNSFGLTITS